MIFNTPNKNARISLVKRVVSVGIFTTLSLSPFAAVAAVDFGTGMYDPGTQTTQPTITSTPDSNHADAGPSTSKGTSDSAINASGAPAAVGSTPTTASTQSGGNAALPVAPTDPISKMLESIVHFFSYLVLLGGIALNGAAYYSIVYMGTLLNQISALQLAWSIFRDISNIVLIFAFIAIGVSTILDIGGHGSSKKLVTLIIVAVTINFSSLAARTVIDVGNITAIQFYKALNGGQIPTGVQESGISNALMNSVSLQTLYKSGGSTVTTGSYFLIAVLSIILFIVIFFVFIAIAIMLVARFVILVFLITISPLAFAAMVIPRFESQSKKWWNALLNQTFSAPAMLLLILISTKVVTSTGFTNLIAGGGGWSQFSGDANAVAGAGSGNTLIIFMIACGFYLTSLVMGKQMSAFGADFAINTSRKVTSGILTPITRPSRAVARYTAGKTGAAASRFYDAKIASNKYIGGTFRALGIDDAIHGGLTKVKDAKIGGSSYEEKKKHVEHRAHEAHDAAEASKLTAEIAQGTLSTGSLKILNGMSAAQLSQLKGIKTANPTVIDKLSAEQFENLMKKDNDKLTEGEKAHIAEARYSKYNEAVKAVDAAAAGTPARKVAENNLKSIVKSASKADLENMPGDILTKDALLAQLSDKQREDLGDSKKLTVEQRNKVKASSKVAGLVNPFNDATAALDKATAAFDAATRTGNATEIAAATAEQATQTINKAAAIAKIAAEIGTLNASQAANISAEILRDPTVAVKIGGSTLQELQKSNKLSTEDMRRIGIIIRSTPGAAGERYLAGPAGTVW
jgi:hypothetical protein